MRFGKRRNKEAPEGEGSVEAPPAPDQATEDWLTTQPGVDGQESLSMPPPEGVRVSPVVGSEPEPPPEADAVVEGEAVELPYEPPVAAEPAVEPMPAYEPPAYDPPAYYPPAPHPVEPEPAARLAASTPRHEPGIRPASGGAWPDPAFDLAERPEILVGAAFGGGVLLALILRRLGH